MSQLLVCLVCKLNHSVSWCPSFVCCNIGAWGVGQFHLCACTSCIGCTLISERGTVMQLSPKLISIIIKLMRFVYVCHCLLVTSLGV